jgi:hypothetical protein
MVLTANLKIDHVTFAGSNLKQMRASLAALGIPTEYGGPHANGATEMALATFPDGSYLELIAWKGNPDPSHYWAKQLTGNAGPTAWAVRSADVSAEVARLKASGITVGPPPRNGRTRPDGFRLEWETARIGIEPNGTFFPFLIRDFTPREERTGKPMQHQSFTGIKQVVIAVGDLKSSIARFRQAYDLPAPSEEDGRASFTGTPIVLIKGDVGRIRQFGEGPSAFVVGPNTVIAPLK